MEAFRYTKIWRQCFESSVDAYSKNISEKLASAYLDAREKTMTLVNEISIDLPQYTVHDISHIDALWSVASQVVGDEVTLNPVEGYVLGCSFLMHDAAMSLAAYPGGLNEIKKSADWKRISAKLQANLSVGQRLDDRIILEIFLREQHAVRAARLPFVGWGHPDTKPGVRYIIDDSDLRQKFGEMIGKISASHWWSYDKIENDLNYQNPAAPPPYPDNWSIDHLKLACILRTADAAQIDSTRAPGLLFALRKERLNATSYDHWSFQNKLSQPQGYDGALHFSSTMSFGREEAGRWWMLYDTLKMIDRELRQTDELLTRVRDKKIRFASRKVAHVQYPQELTRVINTEKWTPVDTNFSIRDIPKIVKSLGGKELYGDDSFVAVREVVQNAMDAVRMRLLIDSSTIDPKVTVELKFEDEEARLIVEDNGVGMSQKEILEHLLSFGSSGWLNDPSIGEYTDIFPSKASVSGRYGIGFFSIFMLGEKIKVTTCRFDKGSDETTVLEFNEGLDERPLLYNPERNRRITTGGTQVEVHLDLERIRRLSGKGSSRISSWFQDDDEGAALISLLGQMFPASDVPIFINVSGKVTIIDGRDWLKEDAAKLLARIEGESSEALNLPEYVNALRPIYSSTGQALGRASILPEVWKRSGRRSRAMVHGAVTSNGTRLADGSFRGLLLGTPERASRDSASLIAGSAELAVWSTEQAQILSGVIKDDDEQIGIAKMVHLLGGSPEGLKICKMGDNYVSAQELRIFLSSVDEVWLISDTELSLTQRDISFLDLNENVVAVDVGMPSLIDDMWWPEDFMSLRKFVADLITEEFELVPEIADKWNETDEKRIHPLYQFPVPIGVARNRGVIHRNGEYYKRGMDLNFIDHYSYKRDDTDLED